MMCFRRLSFVSILLACLPLCPASNATAAEPERKITVSASADIEVAPDEVLISFYVRTKDKILLMVKAENDKISKAVLDLRQAHDIPDDRFTTTITFDMLKITH